VGNPEEEKPRENAGFPPRGEKQGPERSKKLLGGFLNAIGPEQDLRRR